jgi:hypothetical protein
MNIEKIIPEPFLYWLEHAFCLNYWAWTHALFGAIAGHLCRGLPLPVWLMVLCALAVAVGWELLEARSNLRKVFSLDSIGDIILGVLFFYLAV